MGSLTQEDLHQATRSFGLPDKSKKNDTAASEVASKYGIQLYRYLKSLRFEKLAHDNYDLEYASQLDKSLPDCFLNEGNESCTRADDGCLALHHCSKTDVIPSMCNHLVLNLLTLYPSNRGILIMVAVLLAVPLCDDMEEAAIEEELLLHSLSVLAAGDCRTGTWLAVCPMQLSLNTRMFVLPWFAVGGAVALLLANPLSATNIILNIAAIAFITEVDDVLAQLLIPGEEGEEGEESEGRALLGWAKADNLVKQWRDDERAASNFEVHHKVPWLVVPIRIAHKAYSRA